MLRDLIGIIFLVLIVVVPLVLLLGTAGLVMWAFKTVMPLIEDWRRRPSP